MAAAYAASYAVGLVITGLRLRRRLEGRLDGKRLLRSYGKLTFAATTAGVVGWVAARACAGLVAAPAAASLLALAAGGLVMLALFVLLARLLRITELRGLPAERNRRPQLTRCRHCRVLFQQDGLPGGIRGKRVNGWCSRR
jgi:putative peptidoglycan lipid II flippase